ncbi:MAG TPA: SIR2 family protein, partial [Thermoanaerobaculia bacterium]|nr:SIR2 family protein [Thermoanaerobaculia bacterium]
MFQEGAPNTNHLFLAKLARAGCLKTVCTTNFDLLLERAFEAEGLERGRDYEVIYKDEDFTHLRAQAAGPVRILKLHGSVEDPYEMAITLRQVARKGFSPGIHHAIRHLFSEGDHERVLILGYSCSDIFDISPGIRGIRESRKLVTLIEHHPTEENRDKPAWTREDIRASAIKNPFEDFMGGERVYCGTDEFVRDLWARLLTDSYVKPERASTFWERYVEEWDREVRHPERQACHHLAGRLLDFLEDYPGAVTCFERGLEAARQLADEGQRLLCLTALGNTHMDAGEYPKARSCYKQGLRIAKRQKDRGSEAAILGGLGRLSCRLG